jgi:ABC-type nitrate/sulfonate/bicarbonate transport system substrate-binding protein
MDRPLLGEKVLRALVKAENFVRSYPDEARDIVGQRLAFSDDYMAHAWQKGKFEVTLPRSLTLAMEDQTRWLMQNGLPGWKEMPNYLNLIHFGSLQAVRPESITIVH